MGHHTFLVTLCFDGVNTHLRARAVLNTLVMANLAENLTVSPWVNLSHCQLCGAVEASRTSLVEFHSIQNYFLCFINSASTPSAALSLILLKCEI